MVRQRPSFYAVARGRQIGIFCSWAECKAQVDGASGALYKGFATQREAHDFIMLHNPDCRVQYTMEEQPLAEGSGRNSQRALAMEEGVNRSGGTHIPSQTRPRRGVESGQTNDESARSSISKSAAQVSQRRSHDLVRTIEVYTDGACADNGRVTARAGWGVYWPVGQGDDLIGLNESGRLPGDQSQQTNNRGELMGIIRAVQLCPDPDAQLVIYTDSAYCINAINEWQANWRRNGWLSSTGLPVLNKDLIRMLERELRARRLRPILVKVRGHSTNVGNREADRLAVLGANLPIVPLPHWPNYEPPESEEESEEQSLERAVQSWHNLGLSIEEARERARPSLK